MSQDNGELMLCGVYECNYTSASGEIKHITPTHEYHKRLNIDEDITRTLLPFYIDVNFDGINQFESQFHIVLRFNNISDNIIVRLKKMYIVHEGIPVQIHNLNCYLLGKNTKINNNLRMSLLGSSKIKNKIQYFRSIRVVIKIDDPNNLNNTNDDDMKNNNKQSIRILIDYYVNLNELLSSINIIRDKTINLNDNLNNKYLEVENLDEISSETSNDDYLSTPILMPTMGHR